MVEGLNYCVNITVIIHLGNTASISGRNVAEKKRLFIFANYTLTSLQNCIAGVCGVIYSRRVTIETVFMLRASMGNTATLLTYVLASYFSHFVKSERFVCCNQMIIPLMINYHNTSNAKNMKIKVLPSSD